MSDSFPTRCLILACGNTLRGDDGVGPWLAAWARERFRSEPRVEVIARQQWTPELAEDISRTRSVIFVDCSIVSEPGSVDCVPVSVAAGDRALATHSLGAPELLAVAHELYGCAPAHALLLSVGAGSTEMGEQFSAAVQAAQPEACRILEQAILSLLRES
jgi:hydrogenase maturation protease